MDIDCAGFTSRGRRTNNEDAFCLEPRLGLYAVADGMGGYEGGEVASRITIDTLAELLRRLDADDDATWPFGLDPRLDLDENLVSAATRLAHRQVSARRVGPLAHMGSTLSMLVLRAGHAVLGHVGDSRIYRLRAGGLEQLTRDHSLWADMRAAGVDVPARHACGFGNVITRALGIPGEMRPDVRREALAAGDVYLLCTDGLTERLDDDALAALLDGAADARGAARALVEAAYDAGSRDNITAVVLRPHNNAGNG